LTLENNSEKIKMTKSTPLKKTYELLIKNYHEILVRGVSEEISSKEYFQLGKICVRNSLRLKKAKMLYGSWNLENLSSWYISQSKPNGQIPFPYISDLKI